MKHGHCNGSLDLLLVICLICPEQFCLLPGQPCLEVSLGPITRMLDKHGWNRLGSANLGITEHDRCGTEPPPAHIIDQAYLLLSRFLVHNNRLYRSNISLEAVENGVSALG